MATKSKKKSKPCPETGEACEYPRICSAMEDGCVLQASKNLVGKGTPTRKGKPGNVTGPSGY